MEVDHAMSVLEQREEAIETSTRFLLLLTMVFVLVLVLVVVVQVFKLWWP